MVKTTDAAKLASFTAAEEMAKDFYGRFIPVGGMVRGNLNTRIEETHHYDRGSKRIKNPSKREHLKELIELEYEAYRELIAQE